MLAVLVAPRCVVCSDLLDAPTRGVACARCWAGLEVFTPPVCDHCGLPVLRSAPCGPCLAGTRLPHLARLRAVGPYDGVLRALLHALKYDGRRSLARQMGPLIRARCTDVLDGAELVVPVPLHTGRLRERGFNQAADIASTLGLPRAHALARTVATPPLARLSDAERARNVRHAFARRSAIVRERVVVIVDDVCTTGATLDACARVLLGAGAREVRGVTIAQALLHRGQADRTAASPAP